MTTTKFKVTDHTQSQSGADEADLGDEREIGLASDTEVVTEPFHTDVNANDTYTADELTDLVLDRINLGNRTGLSVSSEDRVNQTNMEWDVHNSKLPAANVLMHNSATLREFEGSRNGSNSSSDTPPPSSHLDDKDSHHLTSGNISAIDTDARLNTTDTHNLPADLNSNMTLAATSNATLPGNYTQTSRYITSDDYDPEEATNVINEEADYGDYNYDYDDDDYYYDDRDSNRTPKEYDGDDEDDGDDDYNDSGDSYDNNRDMFYRQDDFTRYENDNYTDYDYNYTLEGGGESWDYNGDDEKDSEDDSDEEASFDADDYKNNHKDDSWMNNPGGGRLEGSEIFYGPGAHETYLGPEEKLKLSKGEPVEIHPSFLDHTSSEASLGILVFYTWIGVVTVLIIGAFIALKHRHRIATYVWDSRSGYRKETVFATEEGRNLLNNQQT